jgi:hypothetical protein
MTKNKTTFAFMKKQRKFLYKIIFLLVVFFSYGINAYSNIDIQQYTINLSEEHKSDEDRFSSNNDSSNEDQIDQPDKLVSTHGISWQNQNSKDFSLVFNYCLSVWQPPKIS